MDTPGSGRLDEGSQPQFLLHLTVPRSQPSKEGEDIANSIFLKIIYPAINMDNRAAFVIRTENTPIGILEEFAYNFLELTQSNKMLKKIFP